MSEAAPGWYPSSSDSNVEMYWTGSEWITPGRLRAGAVLATEVAAPTSGVVIVGRVLWVAGAVVGAFGFFWNVTFFISQSQYPISAIGAWNLLVGAAFLLLGLVALVVGLVLASVGKRRASRSV